MISTEITKQTHICTFIKWPKSVHTVYYVNVWYAYKYITWSGKKTKQAECKKKFKNV